MYHPFLIVFILQSTR